MAAPSMNFDEEKKAISCFGEPASAYMYIMVKLSPHTIPLSLRSYITITMICIETGYPPGLEMRVRIASCRPRSFVHLQRGEADATVSSCAACHIRSC
eukprot:1327983-Prymnesium_polylepis.1